MKLKYKTLTSDLFALAFLELRTSNPQQPLIVYDTPFGDMTLPQEFLQLAKNVTISKRGKLDVRYQLMPDQKKLLKRIVKDVCTDSVVRKDLEVALRALITKCVALDTPKHVTTELPHRFYKVEIKVGK